LSVVVFYLLAFCQLFFICHFGVEFFLVFFISIDLFTSFLDIRKSLYRFKNKKDKDDRQENINDLSFSKNKNSDISKFKIDENFEKKKKKGLILATFPSFFNFSHNCKPLPIFMKL